MVKESEKNEAYLNMLFPVERSSIRRRAFATLTYVLIYMVCFRLLENRSVPIRLLGSALDRKIPFISAFIIPYFLWFFFLAGTILFFIFFVISDRECNDLLLILGIGCTIFLVVSYLFPNGLNLRPSYTGSDIFGRMVAYLYSIDTSTNVFPSIHVFASVTCCTALLRHEGVRKHRIICAGIVVLTVSIILSTLFLKQHCIADVSCALGMNLCSAAIVFRPAERKSRSLQKSRT